MTGESVGGGEGLRRWAKQLAALSDESIGDIGREAELGSAMNFASALPQLRVIRELVTALADNDPAYEPSGLANEVTSQLDLVEREMRLVRAFNPARPNAAQNRQGILDRVRNLHDWFVGTVGPLLHVPRLAAIEAIERRLNEAAEKYREVVTAVQAHAGAEAASELEVHFNEQAKGHEKLSKRMLVGGIGLAVVLVMTVVLFYVGPFGLALPATTDWVELARQGLPRLFILAILAYGVRFCVRNYSVNKHLQVVNELRANILRIYPLLITSMDDSDKKGRLAILLAQAAVAGTESGYLSMAEDKGIQNSALAVAELLRR